MTHELPSDWNLILKLHPLLEERDPALFYRLNLLERDNLLILHKFPPVYPILEQIDAYLGDYSSIGYDVLSLRKPMFFWQQEGLPPARIHSCGQILDPEKHTFDQIELGLKVSQQFIPNQIALYNHAFDPKGLQSLTGGSIYTKLRSARSPADASASKS